MCGKCLGTVGVGTGGLAVLALQGHHPPVAATPRIPEGTGARIKARRKDVQLTQAKVARAVAQRVGRDYEAGWLANIEGGRASMRLDTAIALADVLECSLDYIFGRSGAVEVKTAGLASSPLDDDLAPVEELPVNESSPPIPLDAAQRSRRAKAPRPRRT